MIENEITGKVIDLCIKIHKKPGPGLKVGITRIVNIFNSAFSALLRDRKIKHAKQIISL